MEFARGSGLLLHPTSLPGRYGIGELGAEARTFLDLLAATGQKLWQVLPLGPTAQGNSPYQAFSAFAGNPWLISTERLVADALAQESDLVDLAALPRDRVDFAALIPAKERLLRRAYAQFRARGAMSRLDAWYAPWLDDYALFMALKDAYQGADWSTWSADLVHREPAALTHARRELADEVNFHRFCQYRFFEDWSQIKREANRRGIQVVGDLPIFVAYNSVDVWCNQRLFLLDDAGRPLAVSGVPPDYFSASGQLWGNPLYRWEVMARDGYRWWVERLRLALTLADIVRIDHFRGFESYWAIPAGHETALHGQWVAGPRDDFFRVVRKALGDLPFIAEDLGLITPEVIALRVRCGLPGMRVLQFAMSDPDNGYLPHHYQRNCVVFTGTHDNNTTRGWWRTTTDAERDFTQRYLGQHLTEETIAWALLRLAWGSVAQTAIAPLQDVLNLDERARMNVPGTDRGNWEWRFGETAFTLALQQRLLDLTRLYGR